MLWVKRSQTDGWANDHKYKYGGAYFDTNGRASKKMIKMVEKDAKQPLAAFEQILGGTVRDARVLLGILKTRWDDK